MRYFKIPLCRFFSEKSENIRGQKTRASGILGQKLRYDRQYNTCSGILIENNFATSIWF